MMAEASSLASSARFSCSTSLRNTRSAKPQSAPAGRTRPRLYSSFAASPQARASASPAGTGVSNSRTSGCIPNGRPSAAPANRVPANRSRSTNAACSADNPFRNAASTPRSR